jgi:hypothetical protein
MYSQHLVELSRVVERNRGVPVITDLLHRLEDARLEEKFSLKIGSDGSVVLFDDVLNVELDVLKEPSYATEDNQE